LPKGRGGCDNIEQQWAPKLTNWPKNIAVEKTEFNLITLRDNLSPWELLKMLEQSVAVSGGQKLYGVTIGHQLSPGRDSQTALMDAVSFQGDCEQQ
jgi:hypothetical protein